MHHLRQIFADLGVERGVFNQFDFEIDARFFQLGLHSLDKGLHACQSGVDCLDGHTIRIACFSQKLFGLVEIVRIKRGLLVCAEIT